MRQNVWCLVRCRVSDITFMRFLRKHTLAGLVRCSPVTSQLPEICSLFPEKLKNHKDLYRFSLENSDVFWGTLAQQRLKWMKPFSSVMDCSIKDGKFAWFLGGKLNVSVNCVDRHVDAFPDRCALIWEKDEPGCHELLTYKQLHVLVCKFANLLKSRNVKKGDRVAIYMAPSPFAVAAMLACARIGAVHTIVFAGFSPESLAARMQDASAETLITTDQLVRGGRVIDLKSLANIAVSKCPFVRNLLVVKRTGTAFVQGPLDIDVNAELEKQSSQCDPEPLDSEDPLFLLYTSGSTGKPKGLLHTQAGYLLHSMLSHKLVFDYSDGDIFGCFADIGWITGHSYVVYGPLANGGTTVLFESTPTYPHPAIRLLLRYGDDFVNKYDLSSLKVLGTVGEPINPEAWDWYHRVVGKERCMVVDTWWQTETGGIMLTPCPADNGAPILPGFAMRPFYGVEPVLMDIQEEETHRQGVLCFSKLGPGIARTIYGDHDRFLQTYFKTYPGLYFTGDGALVDPDGYFQITGRVDDVINVSGHRLGTAEIEDVLTAHDDVAESAVVPFPHELKGEGICAFVTLKEGISKTAEQLENELKMLVKSKIASYAVPEIVKFTPGLPKTRSGKIMRRILRKIASKQFDDFGDVSTLAEPAVVVKIVELFK